MKYKLMIFLLVIISAIHLNAGVTKEKTRKYDIGEIEVQGKYSGKLEMNSEKDYFNKSEFSLEKELFIDDTVIDEMDTKISVKKPVELLRLQKPSIDIAFGSNGYNRYLFLDKLDMDVQNTVSFDVKVLRESTDGYRENMKSSRNGFSGNISYNSFEDEEYIFEVDYQKLSHYLPGSVTRPTPQDSRSDSDYFRLRGGVEKNLTEVSSVLLAGNYNFRERDQFVSGSNEQDFLEGNSFGFESAYYHIFDNKSMLKFSYNFSNEEINSKKENTEFDFQVHQFLVQRDIELNYHSRMILELGYDKNSLFDAEALPRLEITHGNDRGTRINFQIGRGYDSKVIYDSYFVRDVVSYNKNLQHHPQTYDFISAGVEYKPSKELKLGLDFIRRNYDNYLTLIDDITNDFQRWIPSYTNSKTVRNAWKTTAVYQFSEPMSIKAEYLYENFETEQSRQITYVPKHSFETTLNYSINENWYAELKNRIYGKRYADEQNNISLSGYNLMDIKISAGKKMRFQPYAGITNLFNENYEIRKGYPGAPRQYYGGIRIDF